MQLTLLKFLFAIYIVNQDSLQYGHSETWYKYGIERDV